MISQIEQHRGEVGALCRRFGVRRLEVFGSAASGRFGAHSLDIDVLVEFECRGGAGYADRYFGFLEALQDLFGLPVDLVVSDAITNPYFRESIERTKVALYGA